MIEFHQPEETYDSKENKNPIKDNSIFTNQEIEEFKEIALKEYGVKLTDKQTFEQGYVLVSLVETLIKNNRKKKKKVC